MQNSSAWSNFFVLVGFVLFSAALFTENAGEYTLLAIIVTPALFVFFSILAEDCLGKKQPK
jgi:hypothetical protein